MLFLKDPIILAMAAFVAIGLIVLLRNKMRPGGWLIAFTVLLFALPRAGFIIQKINLPLPVGHAVAVGVIFFWLLSGHRWERDQKYLGQFFLFYGMAAGFGLVMGLIRGGNMQIATLEMFFYLVPMGMFFYASETFRNRGHFILFIRTILFLAIVVGLYGIAQRFLGDRVLIDHVTYNSASDLARSYIGHDKVDVRRVLSSYGDPNVLASQLLVFIGIGLALLLYKGLSRRMRLLGLIILVVNIFCMIYTGSRAGLIALLVVGLIVLYWHNPRWALLGLLVVMILGFSFGAELLESTAGERFQETIKSGDSRSEFPKLAWHLLQSFPFGCGLGNQITVEMHKVETVLSVRPAYNVWVGFNSFWLNLFSRLGVPGLLTFLVLLVVLFRYVWYLARTMTHPLARAVLIGSVAGFVGQGLIWMVNNTYMLPGGGLNFWFMLGMMVAGARADAKKGHFLFTGPRELDDPDVGVRGRCRSDGGSTEGPSPFLSPLEEEYYAHLFGEQRVGGVCSDRRGGVGGGVGGGVADGSACESEGDAEKYSVYSNFQNPPPGTDSKGDS